MTSSTLGTGLKKNTILLPILLVLTLGGLLHAQESPYGQPDPSYAQAPPQSQYGEPNQPYEQASPSLSQSQLTDLVAPIALYPDPLLSQILVVSTYPQELMAAAQWLQYNGNLQGQQLMQAAQQQNWDPSIQALVAFPNVMGMLTSNMGWTQELGQAFLAQPSDVMNAIQYLRAQAQSNGRLASTPQLAVNKVYQNGQNAVEIEPTNPQMMYVPAYNPYSVWGPPAEDGGYPALSYAGSVFGSLFSTAINLASMFSGFPGLLGPSGWGWALGWLAHSLFVNNGFLSAFGFLHGGGGGYSRGSSVWVHDASRGGPSYASNGAGRGGWHFGGRDRGFSGGGSRSVSTRQSWPGSGNSYATNRAPTAGNWRNYASNGRGPASQSDGRFPQTYSRQAPSSNWASNRGYQSYNRSAGNSYNGSAYRAPLTDGRSRAQNYGGYSNYNRQQSAPRDFSQTRWNSNRFEQPRMNSNRSFESRGFSGSSKPPKQARFKESNFKQPKFKEPHFKEPHFKQPHFKQPKSHGSGHSGGGKHHR